MSLQRNLWVKVAFSLNPFLNLCVLHNNILHQLKQDRQRSNVVLYIPDLRMLYTSSLTLSKCGLRACLQSSTHRLILAPCSWRSVSASQYWVISLKHKRSAIEISSPATVKCLTTFVILQFTATCYIFSVLKIEGINNV